MYGGTDMDRLSKKKNGLRFKRFFRIQGRSGQSTVEFAAMVPVFLFLVMLLLDGGRAYYTNQVVLNAAREGARVGILPERSAADVVSAVQAIINEAGYTNETLNYSNVGTGVPAGATTTVTVGLPFETLTGTLIPGWEGTIPLMQTVRMRHE